MTAIKRHAFVSQPESDRREHGLPWWTHAVRLVLASLWVFVLTIWCFRIYAFFLFHDSSFYGALGAGVVLRGLRWLWFVALLPSLAFGIVWYSLSYISWRGVFRARPGRRTLERIEVVGAACFAICLWLFIWRITPVPVLWGIGFAVAEPIGLLYYGEQIGAKSDWLFPSIVTLGALGAAVAFGHAWNALTRSRVPHALLVGFVVFALSVGLIVPASGWHRAFADAVPRSLFELPTTSKEARTAFRDGDAEDLERTLRKYLWTHHPADELISIRGNDMVRSDPKEACGTCQLPVTVLGTVTGITVRIGGEDPASREPTLVLEIPLSADEARVYVEPEFAYLRTVALEDLTVEEEWGDWLILKIDADVKYDDVDRLLRQLGGQGVRQVTFAAVPWGHALPPSAVPRLLLDAEAEVPVFRRESSGCRRNVVVVRKFIPGDTTRRCFGRGRSDLRRVAENWKIPVANSLPEEIAIVGEKSFQDFISRLDRVLAGGASTVHVVGEAEDME